MILFPGAAPTSAPGAALDAEAERLCRVDAARLPLRFPRGLVGLPSFRDAYLEADLEPGLFWLEEPADAPLQFLLMDPEPLVGDELEERVLSGDVPGLSVAARPDRLRILAIVTLPDRIGAPATVNLQGPIVIDPYARTGCQVVLPDLPLGSRHPAPLLELASGAGTTTMGAVGG